MEAKDLTHELVLIKCVFFLQGKLRLKLFMHFLSSVKISSVLGISLRVLPKVVPE